MAAYEVRAFLAWRTAQGHGALEMLSAEELVDFAIHESGRGLRSSTMVTAVATVRGFVRYLFATGVTKRDLSEVLPSVPAVRYSGLAKAIDAATVSVLLASCDHTRGVGRRDFAILTLMLRLGLRAIEVARMILDDIDWRAGELVVHGKGGHSDRLPLPADVGEVLADYLRFGRPRTSGRAVFLSTSSPAAPMSRNAVVFVPRTASARAGIPIVAGHRLRHISATRFPGRHRHHDDRLVARSFLDKGDRGVPARGPCPQAAGVGAHRSDACSPAPLSTNRQPLGLPRSTVAMPGPHQPWPARSPPTRNNY
jgi:site-specific recombinase XerD